jgi:glycine cleavage system H protein
VLRPALYYSDKHSWARIMPDKTVKVGITDYAQKQLRDVVFVDLPKVGQKVKQNEPFGTIESVKAVSELYAPVSGEVKEVNDMLVNEPDVINKSPYDLGWIIIIKPSNLVEELKNLLNIEEYNKLLQLM